MSPYRLLPPGKRRFFEKCTVPHSVSLSLCKVYIERTAVLWYTLYKGRCFSPICRSGSPAEKYITGGITMTEQAKKLYAQRLQLMNDAIDMKEPERVPVAPFLGSIVQQMCGSCYKDIYYDYDRAGQAAVDFYTKYPVDAFTGCRFTSGKSLEISGINIIDWPGKPGTINSDYSPHQVREIEYLTPEETYDAMIKDFDGFYFRQYIPRVFEGLKGIETLRFAPSSVMSTGGGFAPVLKPAFLETIEKLQQIAKYDAEAAAKSTEWSTKVEELGIPKLFTGSGQVPFDVISDYFRTTLPAMTDLFEYEDEIIELCNILADRQIESWKYFEGAAMPVKRCSSPCTRPWTAS